MRRVEGVALKDGRTIEADAVVVAIGIRPNAELARAAGLAVKRGIVVDDALETSIAGIHAIGECAEHRGICYGLVEPAHEQARVLAERLAGRDARYAGSVLATNLKVSGVNVFSAGDFLGGDGTEEIVLSDPGIGTLQEARHRGRPARRRGAVRRYRGRPLVSRPDPLRRGHRSDPRRSRLRPRACRTRAAPQQSGGVTCPAISAPSRSAISKASCPGLNAARATRGALPAGKAEPTGPDAIHLKAQDRVDGGGRQARRPGEVQARAASVRCL